VLFNSLEFFVFLACVFLLYWFVFNTSLAGQNLLLLVASYFFYGWWSYGFLGLLILSTLLDFFYGFGVASANKRKSRIFLILSIINNLGILGVFKYYNFFAEQVHRSLTALGFHSNPVFLSIVLPVGISFYTFHGMSYVFDIYRGKQKPVSNFIEYAVFVCFFPLLVAGPIERAGHLLPQVQTKRVFSEKQASEGCRLILWGLFKKIVIADSLARIVDPIFNNYPEQNGVTLIMGAIFFSFQIYGDFSGYTDIALGTAKLFGFELLSNFRFPYFSRDIAEFWRRWHISLSSWFRDYLYIPLGGSKEGTGKAVRNTFIIFLISGFWHGARWNFIAWGFIHACGFLPVFLLGRNRRYVNDVVAADRKIPNRKEVGQMLSTFLFVTIAWVFFRADNIHMALGYFKQIGISMIRHPGQFMLLPDHWNGFIYVALLILTDWWLRRNERELRQISRKDLRIAVNLAMSFFVLYFLINSDITSFIYFQF
jgi:alginate O-acetyltransferase complex protein AlgI